MSRNLNELKEIFATGTYSRSELFVELREIICEELGNNRQKKPHGKYFHDGSYERDLDENYHDNEKKSQITNMCKEYVHHEPSPELQEVVTFACEVAKKLNEPNHNDHYPSGILAPLAREPNLTKTILSFAKENRIDTTNGYPGKLISDIVMQYDADVFKAEKTKNFELNIVYKNLLSFIKDEAIEHRQYPSGTTNAEAEMFDDIRLIYEKIGNTGSEKATQLLEQMSYNAFVEVAANNRQDLPTLKTAEVFLSKFLNNCRDEKLKHEILLRIIPAAAKDTKQEQKTISQNHSEKTR